MVPAEQRTGSMQVGRAVVFNWVAVKELIDLSYDNVTMGVACRVSLKQLNSSSLSATQSSPAFLRLDFAGTLSLVGFAGDAARTQLLVGGHKHEALSVTQVPEVHCYRGQLCRLSRAEAFGLGLGCRSSKTEPTELAS